MSHLDYASSTAALTNAENSITAVGANQAAAVLLTKAYNRVTAGNGAGVRLPPAVAGGVPIVVINDSAASPGVGLTSAISVYPATGESISPNSANVRDYLSGNMAAIYIPITAGLWICVPWDMKADHSSRTIGDFYYFYGLATMYSGLNVSSGITIAGNIGMTVGSTLTTAGTTITANFNTAATNAIDLEGATGTVVLTLSNPQSGGYYRIKIIQGSVARNITWPAAVKWVGGVAPTISVANDAIDLVELHYDGTNYLGSFKQAFA